jgi:hypothetical protein
MLAIICPIMKSHLKNFLDDRGRVKQWPSKRAAQIKVIEYIANHFPKGSKFSESELNEEIKQLHTFGDWAILRREMCDLGYFDRDKSGITYLRTVKT